MKEEGPASRSTGTPRQAVPLHDCRAAGSVPINLVVRLPETEGVKGKRTVEKKSDVRRGINEHLRNPVDTQIPQGRG